MTPPFTPWGPVRRAVIERVWGVRGTNQYQLESAAEFDRYISDLFDVDVAEATSQRLHLGLSAIGKYNPADDEDAIGRTLAKSADRLRAAILRHHPEQVAA